jgi:hypothetical protein
LIRGNPSVRTPAIDGLVEAWLFQRPITIAVEREADRGHRDAWIQSLATATWAHADQDRPTPALTLALPSEKTTQLLVVVDEGDNSPIPITGPRCYCRRID